ncbi:hypothetical protein J6590_012613 [Homalodisca vitripennis]|nr:hypothetical protein J6590_012613 [Homalodisca vitripennis]
MEEMVLDAEETGEPRLTYWKPAPKPTVTTPFAVRNPPYNYNRPFPNPLTPSPPGYQPPSYILPPGFGYPANNVYPYMYNQQLCHGYEGERRRMPQCSQVSPESLLNALSSSNSSVDQDSPSGTDSLIHDEVTRAAKTLFSKRNRTLMHWLKPNISKNQLKMDVNATWDCLPQCEKVFYISQVLGKFAPHTTSLMVNPQLEPTKKESLNSVVTNEVSEADDKTNTSSDSACPSDVVRVKRTKQEPRFRRAGARARNERKPQKRRAESISEDDTSCDSGMVMDLEGTEKVAKEVKVKRQYKRKPKTKIKDENTEENCNSYSPLPVKINDTKMETGAEPGEPPVARVKRKYVKRKLVRKQYKKREPKIKTVTESPQETTVNSTEKPEQPVEDMDIWIDLSNDADLSKEIEEFGLLEDEVDSFWENIGDPNDLFLELEIE